MRRRISTYVRPKRDCDLYAAHILCAVMGFLFPAVQERGAGISAYMRPTIVGPEGNWTHVRLMLVGLMGSPVIQPPTPTPMGASPTLKTSLAMASPRGAAAAAIDAWVGQAKAANPRPYVVVPNRRRRPKHEGRRPQRCSPRG